MLELLDLRERGERLEPTAFEIDPTLQPLDLESLGIQHCANRQPDGLAVLDHQDARGWHPAILPVS